MNSARADFEPPQCVCRPLQRRHRQRTALHSWLSALHIDASRCHLCQVNAGLWTSIPNDLDVITAHVVANVGLLNSQLKAVVSYEDAIIIHASLALWVKTHHTFFLLLNSKVVEFWDHTILDWDSPVCFAALSHLPRCRCRLHPCIPPEAERCNHGKQCLHINYRIYVSHATKRPPELLHSTLCLQCVGPCHEGRPYTQLTQLDLRSSLEHLQEPVLPPLR